MLHTEHCCKLHPVSLRLHLNTSHNGNFRLTLMWACFAKNSSFKVFGTVDSNSFSWRDGNRQSCTLKTLLCETRSCRWWKVDDQSRDWQQALNVQALSYLQRELCFYAYNHLEEPVSDFSLDQDIHPVFKVSSSRILFSWSPTGEYVCTRKVQASIRNLDQDLVCFQINLWGLFCCWLDL